MDQLRRRLTEHARVVAEARTHEFVDHALAARLHAKIDAVLDRWDSLDAGKRALVAETIDYLVDTDDEEHDLRSPIGFVDDAERVDDMLRAVAPDLLTWPG
ncbi:hypothetical protein [Actinokineospora sp.]|uniref:hypothetical protein n=1 Tax=Actinokineospora sp. TaxID=1872133 RepID=UPI003D6C3C5F